MYPVCVGHEIVGRVVRVGSQVKDLKVGDLVGVGAQNDSCLSRKGYCEDCEAGYEQYCRHLVTTYNGVYINGGKSYGGYASYHRSPAHFAIKIPDGLPPEVAAPMMCGGITVYSPLRNYGCGPGKKVGIIGVGGLGHFAIMFAKALGANRVVAISRRSNKREDALKLGADEYIATDEDKGWVAENTRTLDLLVLTVSSSKACHSSVLYHRMNRPY
ncbi:hypothetical protein VTN31DRAFT_6643 [Thermomyces dupontii]|uniref:uncharacterized protein n=1 Tax=Talaromyces thermophilus TaxID=28565 RepID=UPI0037438B6D